MGHPVSPRAETRAQTGAAQPTGPAFSTRTSSSLPACLCRQLGESARPHAPHLGIAAQHAARGADGQVRRHRPSRYNLSAAVCPGAGYTRVRLSDQRAASVSLCSGTRGLRVLGGREKARGAERGKRTRVRGRPRRARHGRAPAHFYVVLEPPRLPVPCYRTEWALRHQIHEFPLPTAIILTTGSWSSWGKIRPPKFKKQHDAN